MSLKFYFDFMSPLSRALYITLKRSNIPFEQKLILLNKGEHLTDQYSEQVSRFKKVPVISDGDFRLTESVAILRYLQREKGLSENLYPADSKKQARVDEFLEWQHNNVLLFCGMYFQLKYLIPRMTGVPSDEGMTNLFESKMVESLDSLETLWLNNQKFINGNEISAADIWASCIVEQPRVAGYNACEGRPILSAWMERVKNTLNPYYDESHIILNKVVKLNQSKL